MDHRRHILPSSFSSQSLDDLNGQSRIRQPLSDSAGNSQLHTLASVGLYHDSKALQPRVERPIYSIPTVPSQPARQPVANTLEIRRQNTRRRRQQRHSRNPILDSPQYQAYRARQIRDGTSENDQKWPEILEIAFLDALIDIPPMGRRKFSLRGKPHGRNELIKDYLWIAYTQSLPHGQPPDPAMERTRKQVSSHIQVLKGFLREHPAFERLFPPNKGPKNGLEDNFKSDPCLRALSEGRLPSRRQDQYMELNQIFSSGHVPMRPVAFWLLISSGSVPNDVHWRLKSEEDLLNDGVVVHKYTGLSSPRPRASLESIPNWRARWPHLAQLHAAGDLACDIIHMDVSLELMTDHAPNGAELLSRTEMVIPGADFSGSAWRSITSLIKPDKLYGEKEDMPLAPYHGPVEIADVSPTETRIRLQFPANPWAHALTCMTNLQLQFEEMRKAQSFGDNSIRGPTRSAREYIDQISMYQELQSSAEPSRLPFIRRAIIVWTFQKTRAGAGGETTWRHLDVAPSRNMCMSPSPHPSQHISATMTEHFNSWAETPLNLQAPSIIDSYTPGLVTPPQTAALQSPFNSTYLHPGSHFDMPSEHLSFVSDTTADSDSTLVNNDTTVHIDRFLSTANAALTDFDQGTNSWHLPTTESFDTDAAWANYTVPATTPQLAWESLPKGQSHTWNEDSQESTTKPTSWTDENATSEKHDWGSNATSPDKPQQGYNGEQRSNSEQAVKIYAEVSSASLPSLSASTTNSSNTKSQGWIGDSDTFDYEGHLANRLK